jgi:DNA-directed RNA polymerase subunit RPC12/RpoP
VIDSILNLLFRCRHRRLTRPVAPITKRGQPPSGSYVVCLDCGKQFVYDVTEMRIGKPIDRAHDVGVLPPNMPEPRKTKAKFALLATASAGFVLGAMLKGRKHRPDPKGSSGSGATDRTNA